MAHMLSRRRVGVRHNLGDKKSTLILPFQPDVKQIYKSARFEPIVPSLPIEPGHDINSKILCLMCLALRILPNDNIAGGIVFLCLETVMNYPFILF